MRATRLSEKQLAASTGLTASQLMVLQEVARTGGATSGAVAAAVQFSQATVTAIVDRLAEREFVIRSRRDQDKRQVWVSATEAGVEALSSAPDMMQDRFRERFDDLPDWEQAMIVAMLERLTALLDADQIDAAPVLSAGAIDRSSPL